MLVPAVNKPSPRTKEMIGPAGTPCLRNVMEVYTGDRPVVPTYSGSSLLMTSATSFRFEVIIPWRARWLYSG